MNRREIRPGLGRIVGGYQENTLGLARLVYQHVQVDTSLPCDSIGEN